MSSLRVKSHAGTENDISVSSTAPDARDVKGIDAASKKMLNRSSAIKPCAVSGSSHVLGVKISRNHRKDTREGDQ